MVQARSNTAGAQAQTGVTAIVVNTDNIFAEAT